MEAFTIPSSHLDLERRRLESTIDQDLASLSLDSLLTTTVSQPSSRTASPPPRLGGTMTMPNDSFSSETTISLEYPRAFGQGETGGLSFSHHHPNHLHSSHHDRPDRLHSAFPGDLNGNRLSGPSGTPRAAARKPSAASAASYPGTSFGASPVSTAGHHVSQVTLADGVFRRHNHNHDAEESEFDPERSLGRLVGELGKAMGSGRMSPRPISPFAHALSPPRSPSPMPSLNMHGKDAYAHAHAHANPNLSLTLNRSDPLPSPPQSRSSKSSGSGPRLGGGVDSGRFSSLARQLGEDLRAQTHASAQAPAPSAPAPAMRRALSDSTAHNVPVQRGAMTPGRTKKGGNVPGGPGKDRLRALQDENRPRSAPAGRTDGLGDITGMTGLLETPAKGGEYGSLDKNGDVGGDAGASIPQTLATLHARLRALETENSLKRRRVRELEGELERAKAEVEAAKRGSEQRLREAIGTKSALEDLVARLQSDLARMTAELEQNKALVSELRLAQSSPASTTGQSSPPVSLSRGGVDAKIAVLENEVERLDREVRRLGGIVEEGLEIRRRGRGERTVRLELEEEELERVRRDVERRSRGARQSSALESAKDKDPVKGPSKLRQGLHASAAQVPTTMPPTVEPPTRFHQGPGPPTPVSDDGALSLSSPTPASRSASRSGSGSGSSQDRRQSDKDEGNDNGNGGKSNGRKSRSAANRVEGPSSPFPSIRAEDEHEFFHLNGLTGTGNTQPRTSRPSRGDPDGAGATNPSPWARKFTSTTTAAAAAAAARWPSPHHIPGLSGGVDEVPPQTVLARVLRELEEDFAHYKAIYAELADQYKVLDPASAVAKRHVLAEHLREVIDLLELKADQIAELYDLLTFHDKPAQPRENGGGTATAKGGRKSVHDVMRMVKESLGEEAMNRLEQDGLGFTTRRKTHKVL